MNQDDFSDAWVERFWSKVEKTDDCWNWNAARLPNGYGSTCVKSLPTNKPVDYVHRLVWMFTHGEIPEGLNVCHVCDNRKCVRPDHLFLGTQKANIDDMVRKRRFARPGMKVSDDDVVIIRARYESGLFTLKALGDEYGISFQQVSRIVRFEERKVIPINV